MKTQTEFYLANQIDGTLTDAQTMQMLTLPEGDSTTVQGGQPEPAANENEPVEVAKEVDPAPTEAQPVILAKDGIHTIPFEKLTEARESEKLARAQLAELQEQLAALKSAPVQEQASSPQPQASTEPQDVAELFGDFSEESSAKGVDKLVAAKTAAIEARLAQLAAVLEPIQSKQVESAADAHFNAINSRHPDVESVVLSQEFANWVSTQPSVARPAIQAAIEQGSATEVIEVLDAYKLASGKKAPARVDATAAAQAAIAKAQAAPPMSLSEIPAGSNAAADEVSAMREMSSTGLMSKFEGKSPEQIMALMNRIL